MARNINVPDMDDFKDWFKEAIDQFLQRITEQAIVQKDLSEPLLSRDELAKELNISLVTLNKWMKKELPYKRIDRRIYFLKSEVMSAMSQSKFKGRKK